MKRVIGVLAAAALVSGCGILGGREKPKTPTIGERIPVLGGEAGIEVDPALADVQISLPVAAPNAEWTQPGGNAAKSMGHLALPAQLNRAWSAKIGRGSESRAICHPLRSAGTPGWTIWWATASGCS